ncbi:MAG TPA: MFS transporter [Bacillota bacterium]|nr:MFS transporter [Bacillota bacterium]
MTDSKSVKIDREAMISKLKRYQWPLYAIVLLAYMLISFSRGAPAIMGPELIKDLSLNAAQWGLVGLTFFWAYALANAPSGGVIDAIGPRKSLLLCLLLIVLGCFVFSAGQTLGMVILGRVLVAVGSAGLMLAGIKLISSWFTVRQFPLYYGCYVGIGGFGSVLATAPLQFLMNSYGWRNSFVIIAVGTLVMTVIAFLIVRDRPADIGLPTPDELAGEEVPQAEQSESKVGYWVAARGLVVLPAFWLIAFFNFGTNSTGQVIGSLWGGVLLANVYGFDKAVVSSILTISAFGRVAGSVVAGAIARRIGTAGVMLSSAVIYIITWLYMLFNLRSLSVAELQAVYTVLGFCEMYAIVGIISTVRSLVPSALVGTGVGLINTLGWVFGAGVFNQVWGLIINSISKGQTPYPVRAFEMAMWVQACALIVTLVCGIILFRMLRKPKADSPAAS